MVGIDFVSFLILFVISLIVTIILHYGLGFYIRTGWDSVVSKIIVGWIGGWLGSPVYGHWFQHPQLQYESVYFIPAILGSLSLIILTVDVIKSTRQ